MVDASFKYRSFPYLSQEELRMYSDPDMHSEASILRGSLENAIVRPDAFSIDARGFDAGLSTAWEQLQIQAPDLHVATTEIRLLPGDNPYLFDFILSVMVFNHRYNVRCVFTFERLRFMPDPVRVIVGMLLRTIGYRKETGASGIGQRFKWDTTATER